MCFPLAVTFAVVPQVDKSRTDYEVGREGVRRREGGRERRDGRLQSDAPASPASPASPAPQEMNNNMNKKIDEKNVKIIE